MLVLPVPVGDVMKIGLKSSINLSIIVL